MDSIRKIYFKRIILDNEDHLYSDSQNSIHLIAEAVVLELNRGVFKIITLNNQKIEYSLKVSYLSIKGLVRMDRNLDKSNESYFKSLVNKKIISISYLYLNNEEEIVINEYVDGQNLDDNLIGIKYQLENLDELFIYSSEPEIVNQNEVEIFRPNSIISLIVNKHNNDALLALDNKVFPKRYKMNFENLS